MARCSATGKEKYPSRFEGQLAMSNISKQDAKHRKQRFRETPTRVYPCGSCHGYHMTSK